MVAQGCDTVSVPPLGDPDTLTEEPERHMDIHDDRNRAAMDAELRASGVSIAPGVPLRPDVGALLWEGAEWFSER